MTEAGRYDLGGLARAHKRAGNDPLEPDRGQPTGQRLSLHATRIGQFDVDALPEMLLRRRTLGEAVSGQDEGEHVACSVGCGPEVDPRP